MRSNGKWQPCREGLRKRAGLEWGSGIGELRPDGEWFRQEMPTSGFSHRDVDHLCQNRKTGEAGVWEWSGVPISDSKLADIEAFRRADGPYAVHLQNDDASRANVPSAIHYPAPCSCCGMPPQPVVADRIYVKGPDLAEREVTVKELKGYLLDPHLWYEP